jgi:tetratricopeptide (TPR) repeat protein
VTTRLLACLCLCGLAGFAPADATAPTLAEARSRWLHGNYDEARSAYTALAAAPKDRPAAAIGLSRVLESVGDYDGALRAIDDALGANAKDAELHARRAELLYLRGRWDDAEKAVADALKEKPDHLRARFVRAQITRDRGDLDKSDEEFRWFVRTYTQRSGTDQEIKAPEDLLIVGQAGVENARRHSLTRQFSFILNEVYGDAGKAEKDLWQAEYLAGRLLLDKYNRGEALEAFDKALAVNPRAALALTGKAEAAMQRYEVKDAEQALDQALKVNPRLPEALRQRADLHLMTGELAAAEHDLTEARKVNPRDERTLGRLAACLLLKHDQPAYDKVFEEVKGFTRRPGLFLYELGERLEERKFFEKAGDLYRQAIEQRPDLPEPRNALGLLALRLGQEAEAKKLLEKAFESDRFNIRVANSLKVIRHLEKYETIKTAHFELRFDPKTDRALANYLVPYLEELYEKYAGQFQYRPKDLILIELFNNHEMFSGRIVSLPDLHTIGACTGKVMGMVSPRGQGIRKPFNWGRVVRHELVHIFNLAQTDFQVPHWLTEGLAVKNEGFPRPALWHRILAERLAADDLLNLDTITLGFVRPRSPAEWTLAYCQSNLYVEYLVKTHGPEAVGALLSAFHDGLDNDAAIRRTCKVEKADFERGYRAYLQEVLKSAGVRPVEKSQTLKELEEANKKNPDDLDTAAKLAEQYQRRRRNDEARKLVEGVLEKKKNHTLAAVVKARLLLADDDTESARTLLESALDRSAPDPRVLLALGRLYFEAKKLDQAAELFELGRKVDAGDPVWLELLAKVYNQTENRPALLEVLKALVPTDADDLPSRKRLAAMLVEDRRFAEAEPVAREALEIDVQDEEVRDLLLKALAGQNKSEEAERLRKLWKE